MGGLPCDVGGNHFLRSMSWEFVDDALQYKNPVDNVFSEAQEIWGTARPKLLLSIGTGNAPDDQFKNKLSTVVKKLKELATETERTADDFYRTHQTFQRAKIFPIQCTNREDRIG